VKYRSPEQIYGELYYDLHNSGLWKDGKKIADAIPRVSPEQILENYQVQRVEKAFDLKSFFKTHFKCKKKKHSTKKGVDKTCDQYISSYWDTLSQQNKTVTEGCSLMSLPYSYVVPGGRFNEMQYWGSYFTLLGLRDHGKWGLIKNMIDNLSFMVDKNGHIPSGNRTYYLSRSQPPFYSLMVKMLSEKLGPTIISHYLPQMIKEYNYWMSGSNDVLVGATQRVVKINNYIANRYYDNLTTPRMEMYRSDFKLAESLDQNSETFFQNIRAACESGWDFSSRWFSNYRDMNTIDTCNVVPIDLNCLLYNLEKTIAEAYQHNGEGDNYSLYSDKAEHRKAMINELMWDDDDEYYFDYHHKSQSLNGCITAAGMYPLFLNIATQDQADACAETVQYFLMKTGGIVTTTNNTGEQWDAPNGWAPLQWIVIQGLRNYGHNDLAFELTRRWLSLCENVYNDTGKLYEKYNVEDIKSKPRSGDYPLQEGFGWTNGVYVALKNQFR